MTANKEICFEDWIAGVQSELAAEELDSESFRPLYEEGMSPADAVLHDRLQAGVMESQGSV